MKIKNIALLISLSVWHFQSMACDNSTLKYFSWAGLKTTPASMSGQITESEAKKRHDNGEAYYSQLTCDNGDILSVTKYYDGKIFFNIDYMHQTGGSIMVLSTNADGKVNKRHAK